MRKFSISCFLAISPQPWWISSHVCAGKYSTRFTDTHLQISRALSLSLSSLMLCSSLLSNTVSPNSSHTLISLFLAVSTRLWALLSVSCSLQTASRGNLGICRAYIICVTFLGNHSLPLLFVQYLKVIVSYICLCGLLPMVLNICSVVPTLVPVQSCFILKVSNGLLLFMHLCIHLFILYITARKLCEEK